jgi:hypothetical protein
MEPETMPLVAAVLALAVVWHGIIAVVGAAVDAADAMEDEEQ